MQNKADQVTDRSKFSRHHFVSRWGLWAVLLLLLTALPGPVWGQQIQFPEDFTMTTSQGIEPDGWETDSSPRNIQTYQVINTGVPAGSLDGSVLKITSNDTPNPTPGSTEFQRQKVRTRQSYRTGTYQWRVYIPSDNYHNPDNTNANSVVSCWLFNDFSLTHGDENGREIDFEIGYGRAEDRTHFGLTDSNALIVWMTIQPDRSTGGRTDTIAFMPDDPADHFMADQWYLLTIELTRNHFGHYEVAWKIQPDDPANPNNGTTFIGRTATMAGYGEVDTPMHIYCSVEDLGQQDKNLDNMFDQTGFMGTGLSNKPVVAYFDRVNYTPADPAGPPTLITDVDPVTDQIGTGPASWSKTGGPVLSIGEPAPEGGPQPISSITTNTPGDFIEWLDAIPVNQEGTVGTNVYGVGGFPDPIADNTGLLPNPPPNGNRAKEWTRFGPAFVSITQDPRDTSVGTTLSYAVKRETPGNNSQIQVVLVENDGDIWVSNSIPLPLTTSSYVTHQLLLVESNFNHVQGTGGFDWQIKEIGFDILKGTDTGAVVVHFDNLKFQISGNPPTTITDIEGDSSAGTSNAVPPVMNWGASGPAGGLGASLTISSNTGENNTKSIRATAAFNAGSTYRLRYNPSNAVLDLNPSIADNDLIRVIANWNVPTTNPDTFDGVTWVGTRYYIHDSALPDTDGNGYNDETGTDMNLFNNPVLSAKLKYTPITRTTVQAPEVFLEVVDSDQEVWISKRSETLSTTFESYTFDLDKANFVRNGVSDTYRVQAGQADRITADHASDYTETLNGVATRDNVLNVEAIQAVSFLFISTDANSTNIPALKDLVEFRIDDVQWNTAPKVTNDSLVATVLDWSQATMPFEINYQPQSPLDLSSTPTVSYQMKHEDRTLGTTNNPIVKFQFADASDNWWRIKDGKGEHTLQSTYRRGFFHELIQDNFEPIGGHTVAFDVSAVSKVGFEIDPNGAGTGKSVFQIDDLFGASPLPGAKPALPILTSMESQDTIIDSADTIPDPANPNDPTANIHTAGFAPNIAKDGLAGHAWPFGQAEGTWTGFGIALETYILTEKGPNESFTHDTQCPTDPDAGPSDLGQRRLTLRADWGLDPSTTNRMASVRFLPYDYGNVDLRGLAIDYALRASNAPAAGMTEHRLVLIDRDGTVMFSPWRPVDTGPHFEFITQHVTANFGFAISTEPGEQGNDAFETDTISLIGIDFRNTKLTAGVQTFDIDLIRLILPGDANRDGLVDDADLSLLLTNFGSTPTDWCQADFTGDVLTKDADLSIVLTNFGNDITTFFAPQSIAVVNADFEIITDLSTGGAYPAQIPDWTKYLGNTTMSGPNAGVAVDIPGWTGSRIYNGIACPTPNHLPLGGVNGVITGYSANGSISQTLTEVLEDDQDYTLTVRVGNRANTPGHAVVEANLQAGGIELTPTTSSTPAPPSGGFTVWEFTFDRPGIANPTLVGQPLAIELFCDLGAITYFDDVQLTKQR